MATVRELITQNSKLDTATFYEHLQNQQLNLVGGVTTEYFDSELTASISGIDNTASIDTELTASIDIELSAKVNINLEVNELCI